MIKNALTAISLAATLMATNTATAQNCIWAKMASGTRNELPHCVVTDGAGDIYITGEFDSPTVTFGTTVLTNGGSAATNTFLAKYDASGSVLWAKSFGGSLKDIAYAMTTDPSGNIYIYGTYESPTITFGSTTLTNFSGRDNFLVKLDNTGSVIWAKYQKCAMGSTYTAQATAITADESGNVYTTGYFDSSITIGTNYLAHSAGLGGSVFIAKYDASGNVIWAKCSQGAGDDGSTSIAVDASGNSFITGSYTSTGISFDAITLSNSYFNNTCFFLTKYDVSGNAVWAKNMSLGTDEDITGNAVVTDPSGNIYVAGDFNGTTATFGTTTLTNATSGSDDIFLVKYDGSGNVTWAKSAGGTSDDNVASIVLDAAGNIFMGGEFLSPSITFGTTTLPNMGMFLAKYNSAGTPVWAKGAANVSSSDALSISHGSSGSIYVTGIYNSNFTLDATTLIDPESPYVAPYVAKYSDLTLGITRADDTPENIQTFPNPVKDQLTISYSANIQHVTISNMLGQAVYDHELNIGKAIIDTKDFVSGIYFVKVNHSDVKKFIKE